MEVLNFIPNMKWNKVISVFTVPDAIRYADEIIYLGEDFMDKYEAPELHRQNEQIKRKNNRTERKLLLERI